MKINGDDRRTDMGNHCKRWVIYIYLDIEEKHVERNGSKMLKMKRVTILNFSNLFK